MSYKQRRAQRQAARIENKAKKQDREQDRKDKKVELRQGRRTDRMNRKQDRKDLGVLNSMRENTNEPMESKVLQAEESQEKNAGRTDLTPMEATKGLNYLKRRGKTPITETDPKIIGAQVMDAREQEIAEKNKATRAEMEGLNWGADESERDLEELPDLEDSHEDIMEEEFDSFGFNQSDEDYLDPDTVGALYAVGQAGVEKYRQNQFKQGKKAFGKTQKQWEAEQARKKAIAADPSQDKSIINEMLRKGEDVATKQTIKDYTPQIIVVSIVIIAAVVFAYYKGSKK